jgi:hypothetical protein
LPEIDREDETDRACAHDDDVSQAR